MSNNLRFAVKNIYRQNYYHTKKPGYRYLLNKQLGNNDKVLVYLGREYPTGEEYFKQKLKKAFMRNKDETDPEKIKMLIARGEYVVKEIEALYMLRKYRTLKRRYYTDNN